MQLGLARFKARACDVQQQVNTLTIEQSIFSKFTASMHYDQTYTGHVGMK